jgi:hypothetical protein
VLDRKDRRYFGRQTVYFSNDGNYHAVRKGKEERVELFRTADGADLGVFAIPVEQDLEVTVQGRVQRTSSPWPPPEPLRSARS